MWLLFVAASGAAVVDGIQTPLKNKYRIFHPAFPTFVTRPVPVDEVTQLSKVRDALRQAAGDTPSVDFSCLPWKVFPALGISDKQSNVWSKSQIEDAYEKNKHNGFFLWCAWLVGRPAILLSQTRSYGTSSIPCSQGLKRSTSRKRAASC